MKPTANPQTSRRKLFRLRKRTNSYPRPLRLEVINQPVLTFIVSTGFLF
jgi:hypothetical protein